MNYFMLSIRNRCWTCLSLQNLETMCLGSLDDSSCSSSLFVEQSLVEAINDVQYLQVQVLDAGRVYLSNTWKQCFFFWGGGGWTRVVEDVRGFTEFSGWLDPRRPVAYSAGPRLCPWTWPLRNRRWTRISWHQRRPIAFPGRGSFAGGRSSWTSTTTKLNKKKTKRTGVLNEALGFSENILKLKFKMMHTQLSTLFGGKEDSTQLILSSCSCTLALESSSLHLSRKSSTSFSSRAHPARSSSFLLWNWCC